MVPDPGTYRQHDVDSASLETEYMKLGEKCGRVGRRITGGEGIGDEFH